MRLKIIISVLLFIFSFFLIGQNLEKPFWGEHDWNGARYGNIARNYLKYGFLESRFGQIENSGPAKKSEFEYYTHYSPLLPILIALSYKVFGISEWSTRLVSVLATSGSVVLIFLIGSRLYTLKFGILAALMGLLTPMVLYFGKTPVHESLVVLFVLFAFYCYLINSRFIWLGLILAELSTWAGFFLVPAITLVELLRKNYDKMRKTLPYWVLSIAVFLFHLGHTKLLTGDFFGGNLFGALLLRSGVSENGISDLNILNYIKNLRLWVSTLYTNTLLSLVFLWLISRAKGIKDQDYAISTLGICGIIYFIFFPNASFIHNYLTFYLLPFFALAGAGGIKFLISLKLFRKAKFVLVLLFFLGLVFERKAFLGALMASNADHLAVEVGKAIKQQSRENDIIMVSPSKFFHSADNFLKFYSDRKLVYSDSNKIEYDAKVIVNQNSGKFEIIKRK